MGHANSEYSQAIVSSMLHRLELAALYGLRNGGRRTRRRIEIAAKRFTYTPAEITLRKGEPVVLVLHSEDVAHGIKFAELNLKTEIRQRCDQRAAFHA